MKIAIISDTHNNLANLEKFLNSAEKEKIKVLIHCGDVCNAQTLSFIEEKFAGDIYLSLGNCDLKDDLLNAKKKTNIFENIGKIKIDEIKIGFCHQFNFNQEKSLLDNFNFFFFGHYHFPSLKKIKNCFLVNPGNLSGIFYKPTFAILETKKKKLKLKILEKIKTEPAFNKIQNLTSS